jgi:hypothetical protein
MDLEGITTAPLSNHAYGAACLYCHYKTLYSQNALFTYLCTNQDELLASFKRKYLTTAADKSLFSNAQLANLTMLLPADGDLTLSPIRINPLDPITQEGAALENNAKDIPHPVPRELNNVMQKTKDKLYDLIPVLFMDLITSMSNSVTGKLKQKQI